MIAPRERVASAFGRAKHYDAHAPVQRTVAQDLARKIAALDLPGAPHWLEFGCGTGFLTEALAEAGIASAGRGLVTDLAPAMVARCQARLGTGTERRFATLDAEREDPRAKLGARHFDLIVSSLALQWFDDGPAALARMAGWLAPGGHLVVATLGAQTFREWSAAHAALGLVPGTPRFPPAEAFAALAGAQVDVALHVAPCRDARSFLRGVKAIGAGTPHPDHTPLSPAQLRAVMARFERSGPAATYEVVTIHLTKTR